MSDHNFVTDHVRLLLCCWPCLTIPVLLNMLDKQSFTSLSLTLDLSDYISVTDLVRISLPLLNYYCVTDHVGLQLGDCPLDFNPVIDHAGLYLCH